MGLVGLMAYLLFLAAAFWQAWQAALRASHPLARGIAIGVLGLLTALTIHSLSDNLYVHGMGIQVGMALGLTHLSDLTRLSNPLTPVRSIRWVRSFNLVARESDEREDSRP